MRESFLSPPHYTSYGKFHVFKHFGSLLACVATAALHGCYKWELNNFYAYFFLPEDNGMRPAEMAIKHIGHAIKATSQHSSSLTNFTFPVTLSINLLLFYLPYVLTQHVITVQNTSLLPWHATFACQLLWRTCDQSVILFFLLGTT